MLPVLFSTDIPSLTGRSAARSSGDCGSPLRSVRNDRGLSKRCTMLGKQCTLYRVIHNLYKINAIFFVENKVFLSFVAK
jgi:hypothetical protein